jgi:diguanylate cyclase (GGDEF)-like protein
MVKAENILIVDDDKILCEHLKAGMAGEGYNVVAVNKGSVAIEEIKKQPFNLVIVDLVLPDIQGTELMRTIIKRSPDTSFIIFTGYATISSAIEALKSGAYDYIIKPFDIDHLKLVIKRGIEKQRLMVRNRELLERLEKEKYKLEIIMDTYNKIGGIFGLDDLADFVTTQVLEIAEAEKSSLMVVDENTGELVLKGYKGLDKEKVALSMKIGELVAGWVAEQGEALLVQDIDTDPRLRLTSRISRYKTKSFISLPLKIDSQVIGVMNVTDKLADIKVFTEDDLRYLTLIAHQTVIQIENIKLCEKLASLAVTDAVTNLFNHRYFQEQINVEILRAQRYKHTLSFMIFDIDFFKTYNDRYGHLEGDRVLKQVAWIIKQNVRQVDIICRYGGDEFVVILPFTDFNGARFVAEKVRKSIEEMDLLNKETRKVIRVTVSGGVASYRPGLSKEDFIALADRALYKAKGEGRNRICISE